MKHSEQTRRFLPTTLLRTHTPCCYRLVILRALLDVPRESYERKCQQCGQRWSIERTQLPGNEFARYDRLDWESL